MKSVISSVPFLVLCFAVAAAHAQDADTVTVTADRVATDADKLASSVSVIDADEIAARQLRSLPDILADVPGLSLVQTGGEGGQTSLFTRGTDSNHTKILVDGIDIADTTTPSGATDLSKLQAGDIARVEVLRGPASSLYGSDAIGGVINIITKAGDGPPALTLGAEGGSFDSFNQWASLGGAADNLHYQVTLQHSHAGDTPVTPPDLLQPGEQANGDYFDEISASSKLGLNLFHNFDLGLVARWSNSLAKITGDAFDPVTYASYPSPDQTRITLQSYDTRATAHWATSWIDQTIGLAYGSNQGRTADPDNGPSASSGDRVKLDWQGNVALSGDTLLVLGAETARDAMHLPVSAGYSTSAGYGELQSAWGPVFGSASLRYDSNSRFGDRLTWRAAPGFNIESTGTRVKASIGTGFKAPSLDQLYHDYPAFFFVANPDLKPETSLGYEIGADQDFSVLTGLAVKGGVTWFHNDIRNLIADNPSFTTDINIGRARTQGVEAFLAWQANERLGLRADYTYTDATDLGTGLQLLRRPRIKTSLTTDWQALADLRFDATLLYVGPWIDGSRDFSVPRLKTDGYVTMNLAARWKLKDGFTLLGRVTNLFNEGYQNPVGFLGPQRAIYAGVEVHL